MHIDIQTMNREGKSPNLCPVTQSGTGFKVTHLILAFPIICPLSKLQALRGLDGDCRVSSSPSAHAKARPPTSSYSLEKECFFLSNPPLASGPSCFSVTCLPPHTNWGRRPGSSGSFVFLLSSPILSLIRFLR